MAQRKLTSRTETTSALKRVLGNPHLASIVPALPSAELVRLMESVGKEDMQELLAYANAEQIREIIETDAWVSITPNATPQFSPETFLEWMALWNESGADVLTQRVRELGSELVALTLDRYAVVVNIFEVGVNGFNDTFGEYAVIPKDHEIWSLLFEYLSHIWDTDPDYLENVFGQCCQRRSLTVEKTHITNNENLALDVEENREQNRRNKGYATKSSSTAYLMRIRLSTLDDLLIEGRYDEFTAMQIRAIFRNEQTNHTRRDQAPTSTTTTSGDSAMRKGVVEMLHDIQLLAGSAADFTSNATLLLTSSNATTNYLQQQLQTLARSDVVATQCRQREIVYLSNILMAGVLINGNTLNSKDAMVVATNTINLGLTYCIFSDPWLNEEDHLSEFLENEPGLIKAFNIGYRLLLTLAHRAEQALVAAIDHDDVRQFLKNDRAWADEVNHWLVRYQTQRQTHRSHHYSLSQVTELLSVYCNPTTCAELGIIGDDFPRFPASLAPNFRPGIRVDKSAHFVSNPEELEILTTYLTTVRLGT